jgi:hypothetical protein
VIPDPYDDDDDDSPTLQRPPTASNSVARLPAVAVAAAFVEEPSTDTDLVPLDSLADAHTVDSLPPAEAVAHMDLVDYADMETPKIPLDVAAVLLRASQDDDGRGS